MRRSGKVAGSVWMDGSTRDKKQRVVVIRLAKSVWGAGRGWETSLPALGGKWAPSKRAKFSPLIPCPWMSSWQANQRHRPCSSSVGAETTAQPTSRTGTPPSPCPVMHWVVPEIGLKFLRHGNYGSDRAMTACCIRCALRAARVTLGSNGSRNSVERATHGEVGDAGEAMEADIRTHLFKSLEGSWSLERKLNSSNVSEPSGQCQGIARFTIPILGPIGCGIQEHEDVAREMLYHEEGQFQMQAPAPGVHMPYMTFSRNYIWRLNSAKAASGEPLISLWFTKPGTEQLDYLFHILAMDDQTLGQLSEHSRQSASVIQAHGSHLCVEDQYETDYTFRFTDQGDAAEPLLTQWQTIHTVKGPNKDQRIETTFTRE
jgi:hypothetical protein